MTNFRIFCVVFIHIVLCQHISAQQRRNVDYERYIATYKHLAIEQMRVYGIPASITLAQGIFESGAGKSELAVNTNNHFGIKKGAGWNGPVYTHADDRPDDKFRVYTDVRQSFEDHSRILLKPRYQSLFNLDILDYKGWARGLRACGYATSPTYADRLIGIIELYGLHDIDRNALGASAADVAGMSVPVAGSQQVLPPPARVFTTNNQINCVIARQGDDWYLLARELGIKRKKLLKFNESFSEMPIKPGSFVYLSEKAAKGPKDMKRKWHRVSEGESMYDVAQLYGVKLKKLYKLNFKSPDYIPHTGDLLRVR